MTGASINGPKLLPVPKRAGRARRSRWRAYYLVLKGQAFRVVVLEPSVRSVGIREDLEVIWVPDPLARIHVNEHSHRGKSHLAATGSGPDQLGGTGEAEAARFRLWEVCPGSSHKILCERNRSYSEP